MLKVLIKYTFIPLLCLSIYLKLRKLFLLNSAAFTSVFVGFRFIGENQLVTNVLNLVTSIRDIFVKLISKLVNVFLGVNLITWEEHKDLMDSARQSIWIYMSS